LKYAIEQNISKSTLYEKTRKQNQYPWSTVFRSNSLEEVQEAFQKMSNDTTLDNTRCPLRLVEKNEIN